MIEYKSKSERIAEEYRVKHGQNAMKVAFKEKQPMEVLLFLYFVPL